MSTVISSALLANGLRTEFRDTYLKIRNRQKDSRLSMVMDLSVNATNRKHEFGYHEAAPHMALWRRGETVPTDAFGSVQFEAVVHNWARRIPWHKNDRADEQTQSLMDMAKMAGASAGLLPERFFFDLITGNTATLPAVPLAPDGVAMYSATAGSGADRFGVSGGNLLSGNGVATASAIRSDYYAALEQFSLMQDGKGQPLFADEVIDQGAIVIYGAANKEAFEEAFIQTRTGVVIGSDAGSTPTNLVQEAGRTPTLWGSQRISDTDWFIFLKAAPKLPTFLLNREGMKEYQALEGDNNSDHVRDTGEEYVQFETRQGAGIALPYATIKINN